jgi:flagellar biosynthesis protein FliP
MAALRRPLLVLSVALYLTFFLTSPTLAGMVVSLASPDLQSSEMRAEEIRKVQGALENELVRAKLSAYGLTADEVNQKLDRMTDEQIHLLAQASDDILAGGNGVGFAIGILVVILLVVLIIKLMDKTIVIK